MPLEVKKEKQRQGKQRCGEFKAAQTPPTPILSAKVGLRLPPWATQIVIQSDAAPHLTTWEGAFLLPFESPSLQGTIHSCMPCPRQAVHPSNSNTRFSSCHCVKQTPFIAPVWLLEGTFLPHLELSLMTGKISSEIPLHSSRGAGRKDRVVQGPRGSFSSMNP